MTNTLLSQQPTAKPVPRNEGSQRLTHPAECQVMIAAQAVLDKSSDLYKALRSFRRAQGRCKDCPAADHCEPIVNLNRQISTALDQITEEWNLKV